MEDKKQLGPSSAFPSELFGIKEASTSDIFSTIFSLPMKQPSGNQKWSTKQDLSDKNCNPSTANKDKSSNFDKETVEPCYLSSSLYYGGQEMYTQSPTTQTSGSYHTFNKDAGEDDPTGNGSCDECRGNWWKGSLYY